MERRLDGIARLLVGHEVVAAIAMKDNKLYVATNKHIHDRANYGFKVVCQAQRAVRRTSKKFYITVTATLHYGDQHWPVSRHVKFKRNSLNTPWKFVHSCDSKKECNCLEIELSVPKSEHKVADLSDMRTILDFDPELSIPSDVQFKKGAIIDYQPNTVIPQNPLLRRLHHISKYMSFVVKSVSLNHPLDHYQMWLQILRDALYYAIPYWFPKQAPKDCFQPDGTIEKCFVTKLESFISSIHQCLGEKRQCKSDIPTTTEIKTFWQEDLPSLIKNGCIPCPDYLRESTKVKWIKRYFLDLRKLHKFVEDEAKSRTDFAWNLLQQTPSPGTLQSLFVLYDGDGEGVHAELRLLTNLLETNTQRLPMYIGSSKLCCAYCHFFLRAFKVSVSGTHAIAFRYTFTDYFKKPEALKKVLGEELCKKYPALFEGESLVRLIHVLEYLPDLNSNHLDGLLSPDNFETLKAAGLPVVATQSGQDLADDSDEDDD